MQFKFDNERPIYRQLVEQFKIFIIRGLYPPGEKLPSVRDVAMETQVNPNTVQRAFADLEQVGLVYSKRTSGRYITEDQQLIQKVKQQMASETVNDFIDKMDQLAYDKNQMIALIQKDGEEK